MAIRREDFSYIKGRKGKTFGSVCITNNSNYVVLFKGGYVGEVGGKKQAELFIDNLIRYQRLEYTQEYPGGVMAECANCGNRFFIKEPFADQLGRHAVCPECGSSFDI